MSEISRNSIFFSMLLSGKEHFESVKIKINFPVYVAVQNCYLQKH